MNRPQFLAELSQYLTFVTPEQRERIVRYYDAMLVQAGPEGESALFKQIGTPMTVAIAIKRRIEANEPILPEEETVPEAPTMVKYEQAVPLDQQAVSTDEASQSYPPESVQSGESAPTQTEDAAEMSPIEETAEVPSTEETAGAQSPADQAANEETSVETVIAEELSSEETPTLDLPPLKVTELSWEKPKMTFGRFLGAIGIGIVSLCIVVFFCFAAAIGGITIYSGVEIVISGFAVTGYLTDCLMTLGCGFAILSAGLLVMWLAIWAAIKLITGMIRSFNKTPSPEKSGLSVIWKVFWVLFLALIVSAIICAGVSFCLGGDPAVLDENSAVSKFISRITPNYYIDFIRSTGLFR
ncbi:MAG: hypothetical protein EOM14_07830 [Clostridia bacterium]|nr:hypothetical protein [Clostridia bacterium]